MAKLTHLQAIVKLRQEKESGCEWRKKVWKIEHLTDNSEGNTRKRNQSRMKKVGLENLIHL